MSMTSRFSPNSARWPLPQARTSHSWDSPLKLSGMMMPPADSARTSRLETRSHSPTGSTDSVIGFSITSAVTRTPHHMILVDQKELFLAHLHLEPDVRHKEDAIPFL